MKAWRHLRTITHHKILVMKGCFKLGLYRQGLLNFQFGLATAVGLFKGIIGMLLVLVSNRLVSKFSEGSSLF